MFPRAHEARAAGWVTGGVLDKGAAVLRDLDKPRQWATRGRHRGHLKLDS